MGQPAGSVLEVTILGKLHNQTTMSVYHYVVTTTSTIQLPIDEQDAFLNEFHGEGAGDMTASYLQAVPVTWIATGVAAQWVHPVRVRKSLQSWGELGQRTATTVSNLQQSITLQTDLAGRNQIGGKRLPVSPGDCADGNLSAMQRGALQAHATACVQPVLEPVGGGIYYPCVYHRSPNANPRFQQITQAIVQPTARVIRRRTVGLGI